MKGVIICPKDVHLADIKINREGTQSLVETTSGTDWYSLNKIDSWVIDENGLLFLPAAGYRVRGESGNSPTEGFYVVRTASSESVVYYWSFSGTLLALGQWQRCHGRSVRLCCLAQ